MRNDRPLFLTIALVTVGLLAPLAGCDSPTTSRSINTDAQAAAAARAKAIQTAQSIKTQQVAFARSQR